MFPNDQQQPGGQPQHPPLQPQAPQFNYNTAPVQHPSGQYEVVPPMPASPNTGHTGHNAYEFIMAPAAPKAKISLGTGKSFLVRVGFIVGGVVVLLIVVASVLSALTPKGAAPGLTAIAERQQEILRIADDAATKTTGQDTTNFVMNVSVSLTSSQQQVISYLAAHGTKIPTKTLALDQDSKTDQLLADAASANNYDSAAAQTLASQLQTYAGLLKTTYNQTNNKESKALIQQSYNGTVLLLKQAKSLPANQ